MLSNTCFRSLIINDLKEFDLHQVGSNLEHFINDIKQPEVVDFSEIIVALDHFNY